MNNYEKWKQREALKRFRERQKTRAIMKKLKPKKSPSVQAVSGGLPSLGKRR